MDKERTNTKLIILKEFKKTMTDLEISHDRRRLEKAIHLLAQFSENMQEKATADEIMLFFKMTEEVYSFRYQPVYSYSLSEWKRNEPWIKQINGKIEKLLASNIPLDETMDLEKLSNFRKLEQNMYLFLIPYYKWVGNRDKCVFYEKKVLSATKKNIINLLQQANVGQKIKKRDSDGFFVSESDNWTKPFSSLYRQSMERGSAKEFLPLYEEYHQFLLMLFRENEESECLRFLLAESQERLKGLYCNTIWTVKDEIKQKENVLYELEKERAILERNCVNSQI